MLPWVLFADMMDFHNSMCQKVGQGKRHVKVKVLAMSKTVVIRCCKLYAKRDLRLFSPSPLHNNSLAVATHFAPYSAAATNLAVLLLSLSSASALLCCHHVYVSSSSS